MTLLLAPLFLVAACGGRESARPLRLLEFRQQDFDSVALNEELLFYFSSELDRSSITSDSVRVLDAWGREVAGTRSLRGDTLSFLPDLPCASDLSDGGLQPASRYRVVLGGFPRPDGIRSSSGALLSESLVLSFGTARIGKLLFLDPFLGPFPLLPAGKRSELEDGVLVLEYGEALDPSYLPHARFRFSPEASERKPIEAKARLIENRRDRALLRVEPLGEGGAAIGRLPPGTYYLTIQGEPLKTLGEGEVQPGWSFLKLTVPQTRVEPDFGPDPRERSSDIPPGCDGTAVRDGHGPGLFLRYPAAAGSGSAGEVELSTIPPAPDLHATRLWIPSGAKVDLSSATGPVVLRSQTSLVVRGRLERRGAGPGSDTFTQELERAAELPESRWLPLTDWLERLLLDPPQREPWTVLIAGGDIHVPDGGAIEVEGPLVLVAGGWIRIEGLGFSHGNVWKTHPEEGSGPGSRGRNRTLPLVLDPPAINPLRTSLVVGALSRPLPSWQPRASGWDMKFFCHEGAGLLGAHFLQKTPGSKEEREFEDPGELGAGPVRVLLRLELLPGHGEPWDPPRFERLRLEGIPARAPGDSHP